jgi:hypothetical protein
MKTQKANGKTVGFCCAPNKSNQNQPAIFLLHIFSTFFAKNIAKTGAVWYNDMSSLFI